METVLFEITLNDGGVFTVFCENSQQKQKMVKSYYGIEGKVKEIKVITTGIYTVKQWEEILKTI